MPYGKNRWSLTIGLVCIVFAGTSIWGYQRMATGPTGNAILIIAPYWYNGTWVFDDEATGLKREPFVAGVPEMMNVLVKDIPNVLQPIMPLDLPVKVRSWELTVYPRSHIRRWLGRPGQRKLECKRPRKEG